MNVQEQLIARLRSLRSHTRDLQGTLVVDLRSFQRVRDLSFFTLPDSEDDAKISVATSCTALMALVDANNLDGLIPTVDDSKKRSDEDVKKAWKELFAKIVESTWSSSGLRDLNPFTACMVIRAAGYVVFANMLSRDEMLKLKHPYASPSDERWPTSPLESELRDKKEILLQDVVHAIGLKAPKSFEVAGYTAKPTLAYWFLDGIDKADATLGRDEWINITNWARDQFYEQLSYVVSGNDALMDPASLAMAACVISRIRRSLSKNPEMADIGQKLPSGVELTHSIEKVFGKQTDSGIWHKAFPLFHFPKSGAADYTFSFEFLEAVLIEFSWEILSKPEILDRIDKAIQWCDSTRFTFANHDGVFTGWNAGGEVTRLAAGMPEAWATAAVHMFLRELDASISDWLQHLLLARLHATSPKSSKWDNLIDVDIRFPGGLDSTIKDAAEQYLMKSVWEIKPQADAGALRRTPLTSRRSALLFGPPGTSKTSFAKAVAGKLKWPVIVITPSDFLSEGLEKIYARVTEIFTDLMDLSGAVILFDEMDALVQRRENSALDVTRQLLTTSMLPKLADLHDLGRLIFFMNTNHKQQLDAAITRPGRFDLLLFVGPPTWKRKLDGISQIVKDVPEDIIEKIRTQLGELAVNAETQTNLNLFTVADFANFLEHLKRKTKQLDLAAGLNAIDEQGFRNDVSEWAKSYISLSDPAQRSEFENDRDASRIQ